MLAKPDRRASTDMVPRFLRLATMPPTPGEVEPAVQHRGSSLTDVVTSAGVLVGIGLVAIFGGRLLRTIEHDVGSLSTSPPFER
jgi:hypothetical protein